MAFKPISASAAVEVNTTVARLLPIDEVLHAFGISKASLYRGIKAGLLPAPVKISARRVGWRSSDVARVTAGGCNCEVTV